MSFSEKTNQIDGILSEFEKMRDEMQRTLQKKMKGLFKAFFDAHPEVKTVHWTQYTPYFNDGDECVFGVHDVHFTKTLFTELNEREHAWGEEDDGIVIDRLWDDATRKFVKNDIDQTLVNDMNKLSSICMGSANEDVMKAMFGDHVWVKAHANGFDVEEYSHD